MVTIPLVARSPSPKHPADAVASAAAAPAQASATSSPSSGTIPMSQKRPHFVALGAKDEIKHYVATICQQAREASRVMATADTGTKDRALLGLADLIAANRGKLQEANARDVGLAEQTASAHARGEKVHGKVLTAAEIDRLKLSDKAIDTMIEGLRTVAKQQDPIGEISMEDDLHGPLAKITQALQGANVGPDLQAALRLVSDGVRNLSDANESAFNRTPNKIRLGKMTVPLGVVATIYESRPNVTIDIAALCLKSGNAAILRGGSEAINSNKALYALIKQALQSAGLPAAAVQLIETTDRDAVSELVKKDEVDVVVPRGGKSLIKRMRETCTRPMIQHLDGNCHVYVDEHADIDKAVKIAFNAKCHRYGTCNTMETLVVNREIAAQFLPRIAELYSRENVELRADPESLQVLSAAGYKPELLKPATDEDFYTEFLAPVLAIKVVANNDEAIAHINQHASGHTESIVTENAATAQRFLERVDSAIVLHNASTQFADGGEFGMGAEIGISTDRVHARGPVGLEQLTSYKYVVRGRGQTRPG